MKLKLERMEAALFYDALQKEIDDIKETIKRREKESSRISANEIQTLKHLVKTIEKTFEFEDIATLLKNIESLKSYVDPEIMKEYEKRDEDWFKEFKE